MARPIKTGCDYFPHDADMRNHRKVKAIRNNFKNGYAIWAMFLEYLTGADGNEFENSEIEYELISGDFCFPVSEIKPVIDYALKIELLFEKNGFIYSESLNERLKPVFDKRGRQREESKKQQRKNGKFVKINPDATELSLSETSQSKLKEKKEDKILMLEFDIFRKAYPKKKNGLVSEFDYFKKKHPQDYDKIIPLLLPALELEKKEHIRLTANKQFCPNWKDFRTWLNNRCWEAEYPDNDEKSTKKTTILNGKEWNYSDPLWMYELHKSTYNVFNPLSEDEIKQLEIEYKNLYKDKTIGESRYVNR